MNDIRLHRGELYAFVILTFVSIAGLVAGAMTWIPAAREQAASIAGMGVMTFVVSLIVLPMQRMLMRAYYGREMPVMPSILWSAGATLLVIGGWWVLRQM